MHGFHSGMELCLKISCHIYLADSFFYFFKISSASYTSTVQDNIITDCNDHGHRYICMTVNMITLAASKLPPYSCSVHILTRVLRAVVYFITHL